jgi:glycosyltransferase involved in cell wall biosynthesis
MKVLIFNTLYHPNIIGGAEKSVQLLAEELTKRDIEVTVISTHKYEDKILNINGVKVYYLHHRSNYWGIESNGKTVTEKIIWHAKDVYNRGFMYVLEEIFSKEKPDVIHTNNLTGFSIIPWLIAEKFNKPVIHTLRDYNLMCSKSSMYKKNKNCESICRECKIFSVFKKYSSNKYVDYLVGNSNFMIESHKQKGFFKDVNSKSIFNGISLKNKNSHSNLYKKNIFFYMGRIDYTKGVRVLLDTFNDRSDVDLLLAGRVYEKEIEENIKNKVYSNNIKFLGYINPQEVLPSIDVLVAPSLWHEPLPRVILEAYQHNKIVIGSNRGGIPECIADGETGFIFNPDEDKSLEKIIEYIVEKPMKINRMKKNIPNYLKQFDLNITVSEYIQIYNELINSY